MDDIIKALQSHADEEYKEFNCRLVNDNGVKYIGVRTPIIDKFVKEIAKSDWQEFIKAYDKNYYELRIIHGKLLSKIKIDYYELIQMLDEFLPYITSWAICDCSIKHFKQIAGHETECIKIAKQYTESENQFAVRTGLGLLFGNLINDKYIGELLTISKSVKNDGYYAKMMNAWLIAECCAKFPQKVEELLSEQVLDKFTQNKAIQKIKESNKIGKDLKDKLAEYKI
ncbi:MAG: DNA alkylation repair protein [Clostridiales bacterium]|jgi:3-methyladenine DNA glycosylase AlkD|nr:DNA alkylation repair protein [Clostridiales bacterium]